MAARTAEGAALGVLVWLAAGELGFLRLVGVPISRGLWSGALAGALLAAWRLTLVRAAAGVVAALLLVVTSTPLAPALLRSVVRRDVADGARPAVDAVAVLSAEVQVDGLVARQGVERLLAGVAWARALDRPLILSVVRDPHVRGARSSEGDQRSLAALAGATRLHLVDSVRVTRDEAVREAELARRMGWRRLLVVTSLAHARRACAAYERAGVAVVCAPSASRDYPLDSGPRPNGGAGDRVRMFRDWLYETVGWAVYRARGWV